VQTDRRTHCHSEGREPALSGAEVDLELTSADDHFLQKETSAVRLSYQSSENTLRLTLDEERGEVRRVDELPGVIDIAEQGRLVGLEMAGDGVRLGHMLSNWLLDPVAARYVQLDEATAYVSLSAPGETIASEQVRTAEIRLRAELDVSGHLVALAIPRRGHGYEISFPSGNR
jgi:hypothetical protein